MDMEKELKQIAEQTTAKKEAKERKANTFTEGYGIRKLRAARKRQRQAKKMNQRLRRQRTRGK